MRAQGLEPWTYGLKVGAFPQQNTVFTASNIGWPISRNVGKHWVTQGSRLPRNRIKKFEICSRFFIPLPAQTLNQLIFSETFGLRNIEPTLLLCHKE